jgi:hypothetical protein
MCRKEEYPKELFTLIVEYAKKRSEILSANLVETIKTNTPIYYLIGNYTWEFKEDSIYWKEFIKKFHKEEDLVELIYDMYIRNYKEFSNHKWFGCFRYRFIENEKGEGIVKIHFLNNRTSKEGPLASSQKESRLRELKNMFKDVKDNHPNAKYVEGGSWLYNLEAYKRLFPKEYFIYMKSSHPKPQRLVIWGQFVNSEWSIKKDIAERFLNRLASAKTQEDLEKVFELVDLFPKSKIDYFYKFYSII